jgi:hypothetical protein
VNVDVAGGKTTVADEVPARENGLGKAKSAASEAVAGLAGAYESGEHPPCLHGYPNGKECFLCDPNHPYRLKETDKA